jgi:flagellar biosynthesis protein FlhF
MQFETFRGRNMKEALAQVKAVLGADALIESTRQISSGGQGWLDQSFVEIVAASPPAADPRFARAQGHGKSRASRSEKPESGAPGPLKTVRQLSALANGEAFPLVKKIRSEAIDNELRAIRSLLETMSQGKRPRDRAGLMLQAAGIEGALATALAKGALRAARSSPDRLREVLREKLADRLQVLASPADQPGRRIVACVGPTGAGKTTTIAKLAARASLEFGRSVSIITLDTYRVGAVEQMRRFVELIGIPFDVARDRSQFAQALAQRQADLVLVDTAGVSASDSPDLKQLAHCLEAAGDRPIDVLLVVPAGIRALDVGRLKEVYRHPSPTALCVTKLDETSQAGGAVHASLDGSLPIAYLCNGPKVPEDIHDASVQALIDAVLPSLT